MVLYNCCFIFVSGHTVQKYIYIIHISFLLGNNLVWDIIFLRCSIIMFVAYFYFWKNFKETKGLNENQINMLFVNKNQVIDDIISE